MNAYDEYLLERNKLLGKQVDENVGVNSSFNMFIESRSELQEKICNTDPFTKAFNSFQTERMKLEHKLFGVHKEVFGEPTSKGSGNFIEFTGMYFTDMEYKFHWFSSEIEDE